ncbi:23S rRNA (uracil(1939)-C(5))-methyltransferase RlmD [Duncaniella sp.]|uniref:23S rRNA (uracil(1939)-C(5))-methyltransferase RlmD n=1 Tax=Duncaniella sp. TaxID=2518496 RepID=UPI0023C48061|nr:23S rRNA (uracil(1939)-C(5))-methyltransferase RlmD [Duncaniella sp.]MDE5904112.1 23S rRNA (uracil(1939)-C(5))-methyltransferase RlmD [Duncaniella sp.]
MARKKKDLPLLSGVEILDVAAEGNSIARVDDMVVFIPFGAPGDIADVKIDRKKRSYAEGHIERLTQPSPIRVEAKCEHFTLCGGCRWQHLPYEFQLKCKQKQVEDALQRIAKIPYPELTPILGSEEIWEYRNKMEYTFSNKKWLTFDQLRSGEEFPERRAAGFHISGAFDKVLDINKCHLQDDLGNRLRLFVKKFGMDNDYSFYDLREQHGLLRTLMIRIASTGEVMAVMVFGENDEEKISALLSAVATEFPEITSLLYVVNTKVNDTISDQTIHLYRGKEYIEEEMEGLRFRVGPKSFYQTNSRQAYKLYSVARDFARLTGNELVYDLYTGTGTIACFVARNARHVVGIEYVPEAIEDAKINAAINGLGNTEFYAGDMKNVLTSDFIAEHGHPDVMIVDPPRAGMHDDVVKVILEAEPKRIVYVSCNPATQARDLALLHEKYDIEAVQPVDMFPHTQHVENVAALTLRDR